MQIQPILGYFWAIFGLYQPPGPPFWISASPIYISWIRPCIQLRKKEPFSHVFMFTHVYNNISECAPPPPPGRVETGTAYICHCCKFKWWSNKIEWLLNPFKMFRKTYATDSLPGTYTGTEITWGHIESSIYLKKKRTVMLNSQR